MPRSTRIRHRKPSIKVEAGQAIVFDSSGQEVTRQVADQAYSLRGISFPLRILPGDIPAINFAAHKIEPYSFQDGQYELPTDYQLIEQGKGIRLWGERLEEHRDQQRNHSRYSDRI